MATTGMDYKLYDRLPRYITIEDQFNFGMSYVDTPLADGFSRLLVNYDIKNQGNNLVPRGGIKFIDDDLPTFLLNASTPYAVHHIDSALVKSVNGADATIHKYILVAPIVMNTTLAEKCYDLSNIHCFLETDNGFIHASTGIAFQTRTKQKLYGIHGAASLAPDTCNTGVYASIDANTYIPVFDVNGRNGQFMQLVMQFTGEYSFNIQLLKLEPKEIPAAQVINSGYNLMKTDPYSFPNTQNVTGALELGGVIPKDASGKIKLTADVGETLIYHLNYTYPASDASKQYMVQWEVTDTSTGSNTTTVQQVRKSPAYTPGAAITFPFTVPYKQFTMVVKVYDKAVVTAHTYVSDADDMNNLAPIKAITVSSYYTTAGISGNVANLTPNAYDMSTCNNMCTWQQRTVLWGVNNANTTLFVSQPNLPEYVPYPNNVEIFPEDIVHCVPYLTYLLVFTKTKLFQLTLTTDGINTFYTTKCVQEHLVVSPEDASTIRVVKNMVYFKSNNYFYMIVPSIKAGAGELQLAPVSKPIETLLDNFEASIKSIIDNVYNINYTFSLHEGADDSYQIKLCDYSNFMDGSSMRNVYKCQLTVIKGGVLADTRYLDFVLNYDTMLRAWTVYLYESTPWRTLAYESTVTANTILLMPRPETTGGTGVRLQLCKVNPTLPDDTTKLTSDGKQIAFPNYQMLDSGYRAHFPAYLKRFREIQFSINNTAQDTLEFHTSFTVDDDTRRELFNHEVQQITDPTSPDYGLIYVERILDEPIKVAGAINLAGGWILDFSKFPNLTVSKVKYKVAGKGYLGKITILSRNDALYELLGVNWIYRKMNGR